MNRLLLLVFVIVSTSLAFLDETDLDDFDFPKTDDPRYDCFYRSCKKSEKCAKCMAELESTFDNSGATDEILKPWRKGIACMQKAQSSTGEYAFLAGSAYGLCASQFKKSPMIS